MHAITGNIIEPRILGGAMDLHPVVVVLSLMLWGSLWGVVGMILSVPITAVLKICMATLDHPLPRVPSRLLPPPPRARAARRERAPSLTPPAENTPPRAGSPRAAERLGG